MCLKVTIIARSPLAFSERKPGNVFQESVPYVPGATIRGALAGLFLSGNPHPLPHPPGQDCPFCRLFLQQGAVTFTNAYPIQDGDEAVWVLPETAMSCKDEGGFKSERKHGVFDTLIDRLAWEALEPTGMVYSPLCPECLGRADAWRGFYTRHTEHEEHYHRREVAQRLLTRVAINRRRMVAEDRLLYSPYVLSEVSHLDKHCQDEPERHAFTRFTGYIWGLPDTEQQMVERITSLGGGGGRGLGQVKVLAEPVSRDETKEAEALICRLRALNKAIGQTWGRYEALHQNTPHLHHSPQTGVYFTIGLHADAILETVEGLPTMVFDADMLQECTGIQAQLVRSYASYDYSGGWNIAWQLPKESRVVTHMGAVYVFHSAEIQPGDLEQEKPDAKILAWARRLANLEFTGIGHHTTEGYGQVRVADEFHLIRREEAK